MAKLLNGNFLEVQEESENATPNRVANFIRRVVRGEKFLNGSEHRLSVRYPVTMPVKAMPLNDQHLPDGEEFLGVTRDISEGGLSFYHLKPLEARYLKLELVNTIGMEEHLHAVMEVLRCRETGPLYEIGGRFVE